MVQHQPHPQQKRAPEPEDDQGPKKKARATKAKGPESSGTFVFGRLNPSYTRSLLPASSRRGYNQKKRGDAVQVTAQNGACLRHFVTVMRRRLVVCSLLVSDDAVYLYT